MRRRDSMVGLCAIASVVAWPRASAQGQRAGQAARIAALDSSPPASRGALWSIFWKRLGELGYVEGANLRVERRYGDDDPARLPALAAELVAQRPDVFVVATTAVALVAKKATAAIPIVALGPADPVKSGLVASLARPGGNLTGVSFNQAEISAKWVELARELVPRAKSIVYLTDVANSGEMIVYRNVEEGARAAGLGAEVADGVGSAKVEQAFRAMERTRPDVLIVATTSSVLPQRERIIAAAERLRLPVIYARREYVDAGGLVSYATEPSFVATRAAEKVFQILRGASPSELPFEMASTYRLVVNLEAAKRIDLVVPQSILARADEVIRD